MAIRLLNPIRFLLVLHFISALKVVQPQTVEDIAESGTNSIASQSVSSQPASQPDFQRRI